MNALRVNHRIRHLIGPYSDREAEAVADWAASVMPDDTIVSYTADASVLSDKTRFPNFLRICYTNNMYVAAVTKALAARKWTSVVCAMMFVGA